MNKPKGQITPEMRLLALINGWQREAIDRYAAAQRKERELQAQAPGPDDWPPSDFEDVTGWEALNRVRRAEAVILDHCAEMLHAVMAQSAESQRNAG